MPKKTLLLLTLMFIGCGDGSSEDDKSNANAIPGGFLTAEQFKFDTTVRALQPVDVAHQVRGIDYIYQQSKTIRGAQLTTTDISCAIKRDDIVMKGNQLQMWYEYDDSTCLDIKDKYINRLRVFINIGCSGQDLSEYEGGSVREHIYTNGAADFCPDAQTQSTFINAQLTRESASESATVIGGVMSINGGPCVARKESAETSVQGCTFYSRTTKTQKDSEQMETTKLVTLTANNLVGKSGALFYHEGTMDMRVNDWHGLLTYQSESIGPTYKLTNTDGNELTGSYKGGILSQK